MKDVLDTEFIIMNKIHHHITDGIKTITNKPFPHYAPVSKDKEMRTRLGVGGGGKISYKSLYFVHPSLKLVPLFSEMREKSMV